MRLSIRKNTQHPQGSNFRRENDIMSNTDIYSRPTESESIGDSDNNSCSSDSEGIGIQIPSGYLSPSSKSNSGTMPPCINNEDRLIMLAKHPHATDDQVVQVLFRQQQAKNAKLQQMQQQMQEQQQQQPMQEQQQQLQLQQQQQQIQLQQQQSRQRSVASVFPVDADTGEAWERGQPNPNVSTITNTSSNSADSSFQNDTSFDRIWTTEDEESNESVYSGSKEQPSLFNVWRRIFPESDASCSVSSESMVSKQDASLAVSMTSDNTPKISNVDVKARDKRIRLESGNPNQRDKWDHFCYRLMRTKQGLVVLLLVFILILATAVTAVAALKAAQNEDQQNEPDPWPIESPFKPTDDLVRTFSPTSTPTVVATTPSSESPIFEGTVPTLAPTSAPFKAPITQAPTTKSQTTLAPTRQPTKKPATILPTLPSTTSLPTRSPSLSPTKKPTEMPTPKPTTLPTSNPTRTPPTVSPTLAPTVSFVNSVLSELGSPLVGTEADQHFGQSVALSDDGKVLAVGAPLATVSGKAQAGWVQVYEWTDSAGWEPRGLALSGRVAGDQFGSVVAMSSDGTILAVSEPAYDSVNGDNSGNIRVFSYNSLGTYEDYGGEIPGTFATDASGVSLSLSADGQRLVVGAPYHDNGGTSRNISGQVSVYDYHGTWLRSASFAGTAHLDWFGWEVDISSDGRYLCIGAPRNVEYGGYVQCYANSDDDSNWQLMGSTIRNTISPTRYDDNFGLSLSLTKSSTGAVRVAIGSPGKNVDALDAGLVAVYEYNESTNYWKLLGGAIVAETPIQGQELGFAVALQEDYLVVGIPGIAQVERYHCKSDGTWERHPTPLNGMADSSFGYALHLEGETLAIGSAVTTGENLGMVNVYGS